MRFSLLLLPLALAGCATNKPEVQTVVQQVYCVTPDQYKQLVDAEPAKVGNNLTGNAQQDFKIAAGQDILMRTYANGLIKVLGGCIGPGPHDS